MAALVVHQPAGHCSQPARTGRQSSMMTSMCKFGLLELRQVVLAQARPQLQLVAVASTQAAAAPQQACSAAAAVSPLTSKEVSNARQHDQQQHSQLSSHAQQQVQQQSVQQPTQLNSPTQQQQQHMDLQHRHISEAHKQAHLQQQQPASFSAWPGLTAWRAKGVDMGRGWGEKNRPDPSIPPAGAAEAEQVQLPGSLVEVALLVLNTADPDMKAALAHKGWKAYCAGHICLHPGDAAAAAEGRASTGSDGGLGQISSQAQQQQQQQPPDRPARPPKPELVVPKQVPSPKDSHLPLSAHLLHNLAHIELNAVDLAMDTVARFSHLRLPDGFYEDFARVADDEARHYGWCVQRMAELGHSYGDMVAHDLLWEGAQASAGNLAARLAIVPMSQEARGLDAGQRLATRLVGTGDNRSASIVNRIAEEERAHVAVGVEWFGRVCIALGVDPPAAFRAWVCSLGPELLKGPFNHQERQLVGLSKDYYDIASWPQELQQHVVTPAVAAAAKGKGLKVPTTAQSSSSQALHQPQHGMQQPSLQQQHIERSGQVVKHGAGSTAGGNGSLHHLMHVSAVPSAGPELEVLRQRLWAMLQIETKACSM